MAFKIEVGKNNIRIMLKGKAVIRLPKEIAIRALLNAAGGLRSPKDSKILIDRALANKKLVKKVSEDFGKNQMDRRGHLFVFDKYPELSPKEIRDILDTVETTRTKIINKELDQDDPEDVLPEDDSEDDRNNAIADT
jgi:hypothetical protein